jgi:hypothetical protein
VCGEREREGESPGECKHICVHDSQYEIATSIAGEEGPANNPLKVFRIKCLLHLVKSGQWLYFYFNTLTMH